MFNWFKKLFRKSVAAVVGVEHKGAASFRSLELRVRAQELRARVAIHDEVIAARQKAVDELKSEAARLHAAYDDLEAAFDEVGNLF